MATTHRRAITTLFLCTLAYPAHGKGSEELATRLLETSGIHRIYAEGIVAGFRKSTLADKRPEREIACFAGRITPELVLPALASGYAAEFSDGELNLAISFFGSKTGKEYARYQRVKSKEILGVPTTEKLPQFSQRDIEAINSFAETRIGKLILAPNSPMSASARDALRPRLVAFRDQCRGDSK